jgi:hypothetical protein
VAALWHEGRKNLLSNKRLRLRVQNAKLIRAIRCTILGRKVDLHFYAGYFEQKILRLHCLEILKLLHLQLLWCTAAAPALPAVPAGALASAGNAAAAQCTGFYRTCYSGWLNF